ncbi:MAG: hypothetical protein ACJ73S_20975 [Mycobacteriales bacterium]
MAAAGHHVSPRYGRSGPAPRWIPVRPVRTGHRYLAEEHAHADRVYDTCARCTGTARWTRRSSPTRPTR